MNKTPKASQQVLGTVSCPVPERPSAIEACPPQEPVEPCTIVIFGASGDLAFRKLIPSLFDLFVNHKMPGKFIIVGCARTEMDSTAFTARVKEALGEKAKTDNEKWPEFEKRLYYRSIEYDSRQSYATLKDYLKEKEDRHGIPPNRIFYLAIPPTLYKTTARMLGKSGLAHEDEVGGWSRIVVEKPFGHDLASAVDLDRAIHSHFKEHQIFRIDHYLAKETVQNIIMFRFANSIFEPVWNRNYIDQVNITAAETLGVEHRAGYYEQAGVLRDMFQNHMMQLLSLMAMEPPSLFMAERVRDEKVKLYRSLRPFPVDRLEDYLVLGQYAPGKINRRDVPAYRDEPGVSPDSLTPTYAMLKIFVDNWRWQGVPFYLFSGKRLKEKRTEVVVRFKKVPYSMFRQTLGDSITPNSMTFGIYPEEKISLTFQTKVPGSRVCLRPVTMDFHYSAGHEGSAIDAYEKVLLDCMSGDQMLFWRQDGVELCWSFLTPILEKCETCGNRAEMLQFYPAGGQGPKALSMLGTPSQNT
jgi:glucose-6-phosphate 1-dehydrogenase